MAIHRSQIREKAAQYHIESVLDPDRNVIFSAERPDLVDGEHLNDVLNSVEARLRKLGKSDRAIYAVRNIILELACNALMHGPGARTRPELLVVSLYDKTVQVWMFGQGRKSQIDRLRRVIAAIYSIAKPPKHKEILLERRNKELLRTVSSPPPRKYGGGAGMLTIAALSSQKLLFVSSKDDSQSFVLSSTV
ncbi:MAG: hypothetical protein QOD09_5082 [Bradyrhizobium sp.]|jgi:hypothetical protein|nr:hypothetical protein [Bradyrhizobium sp.]